MSIKTPAEATLAPSITICTAFKGQKQLISGPLTAVAIKVKAVAGLNATDVLVFDNLTSQQIDLDLRGSDDDIVKRIQASYQSAPGVDQSATHLSLEPEPAATRPGRPKLGVVAREVTLLPRHWQWLSNQPGGASVALRKLVDAARAASGDRATIRQSQDATYKFMSAMAGNLPGFEEAARTLFARDKDGFEATIKAWPTDIKKHAIKLAAIALTPENQN